MTQLAAAGGAALGPLGLGLPSVRALRLIRRLCRGGPPDDRPTAAVEEAI
jgi:hypothetical protein